MASCLYKGICYIFVFIYFTLRWLICLLSARWSCEVPVQPCGGDDTSASFSTACISVVKMFWNKFGYWDEDLEVLCLLWIWTLTYFDGISIIRLLMVVIIAWHKFEKHAAYISVNVLWMVKSRFVISTNIHSNHGATYGDSSN